MSFGEFSNVWFDLLPKHIHVIEVIYHDQVLIVYIPARHFHYQYCFNFIISEDFKQKAWVIWFFTWIVNSSLCSLPSTGGKPSVSFQSPPSSSWQQQQQQQQQVNQQQIHNSAADNNGQECPPSDLQQLRLKLEQKRKEIERKKQRMEAQQNKMRQRLGKFCSPSFPFVFVVNFQKFQMILKTTLSEIIYFDSFLTCRLYP